MKWFNIFGFIFITVIFAPCHIIISYKNAAAD